MKFVFMDFFYLLYYLVSIKFVLYNKLKRNFAHRLFAKRKWKSIVDAIFNLTAEVKVLLIMIYPSLLLLNILNRVVTLNTFL